MVTLKLLLNRVAWDAVLVLALFGLAYAMNWDVPFWLTFAVIFAILGLQIVHIVRSDKKATLLANQAALEHRIKNA